MLKIFLILLSSLITTTVWAAQCPGVADIISTKGMFYGYYWSLTDSALVDWQTRPGTRLTPANYKTFPENTKLTVSTDNAINAVICYYLLPDGTTISIMASNNKRMDPPLYDPTTNPTGIYRCETTVAAASDCHWNW